MDNSIRDFSDDACQKFMDALADRNIGYEDLLEAAWKYYRKAGIPSGREPERNGALA